MPRTSSTRRTGLRNTRFGSAPPAGTEGEDPRSPAGATASAVPRSQTEVRAEAAAAGARRARAERDLQRYRRTIARLNAAEEETARQAALADGLRRTRVPRSRSLGQVWTLPLSSPTHRGPQRDPTGAQARLDAVDEEDRRLLTLSQLTMGHRELLAAQALYFMGGRIRQPSERPAGPPPASRIERLRGMVKVSTLVPDTREEADQIEMATRKTVAYNDVMLRSGLSPSERAAEIRARFGPLGYNPEHRLDLGWGVIPRVPNFRRNNLSRGDDARAFGIAVRAWNLLVGGGLTPEEITRPSISLHEWLTSIDVTQLDTVDHVVTADPPTEERLMDNYGRQTFAQRACWLASCLRWAAYVPAHADAMEHQIDGAPLPWGQQPGGEPARAIAAPRNLGAWKVRMEAATFDAAAKATRLMKVPVQPRASGAAAAGAAPAAAAPAAAPGSPPVPTASAAPGDKRLLDDELSSDEEVMIPAEVIDSSDEESSTPGAARRPKRARPATPHPGRGQPLNEDTEGVQESLLNAGVNDAQDGELADDEQ